MGIWYRLGTLAVTNGSPIVTGTLTGWLASARPGDALYIGTNPAVEILSVDNNTQITLAANWAGSTVSGASYAIGQGSQWGDVTRLSVEIANLIASQTDILSGIGVPSNSLGSDGSVYFRQDAPEYYAKAAGSWGTALSIMGPAGPAGASYAGTSSTSNTIGTGAKTFTVAAGLAYVVGSRARAADVSNPTTKYVEGVVTAYSGTSLTITVDTTVGSGTITSWTISLAGERGTTGATGPSYAASSSSSVAIGTGTKAFTVAAGLAYVAGLRVRAAYDASNFVEGTVASYTGTTLTITADLAVGSGTLAAWTIGLAGVQGTQGIQGPQGNPGSTGPTGPSFAATSASSNTIGTGAKTFTVAAGLAYVVGSRARAADASNPGTNYIEGVVTAYSGTSMTITADIAVGSGTITSWTISLAGERGLQGTQGLQGVQGNIGPSYSTTSTSTITVGTGSKSFTVAHTDRPYLVGDRLRATSASDVTKVMSGLVTSYSSSTLVINVDIIGAGSGSAADWNIALTGEKGDQGPAGGLTGISATKGNLPVADGTSFGALAVGLNGQSPVADSSQTSGIKWGAVDVGICQGRLTLVSGSGVMTTTQSGKSTLYFTPFGGRDIALYNGSDWRRATFTEVSLSIAALTAATNYDIFGYDNSGTLALESLAWTNATTRATALVAQEGVLCKTGALTRRFLGTIRIDATTGQCTWNMGSTASGGGAANLGVWNMYNRRRVVAKVRDSTASWSYTSATIRSLNNSANNRISFVLGLAEDGIAGVFDGAAFTVASAASAKLGIGLDSTSAFSSSRAFLYAGSSGIQVPGVASFADNSSLGFHYLQALEQSDGTNSNTFYGNGDSSLEASFLM